MCGICGEVSFDPRRPASAERVRRMASRLVHRGPDDEGIEAQGPAALGARRLSIIDLEGGHQPVSNEDGTVWAAQNGEIYNYRELAAELRSRGHRLRTQSDTEVIAHLYEQEGERFAERLDGMFAVAVWDAKRARLLLARDRLGIKPLVYGVLRDEQGPRLAFASELQALLEAAAEAPPLDPEALHHFFSFNYIPAPFTIFEGWRKLLPGHILVFDSGRIVTRSYWDLAYPPSGANGHADAGALAEELREELRGAVRRHLVSDVPVGVLLSGGVDSGGLAALAAAETAGRLQTFSVGFREASYNELGQAREVARRFGTDHHEVMVEPRVADLLEELVRLWGEPFADSSAIPLYHVCQLAASHVKVVLAGDGGDEIFAGYETYAAWQAAALYRRVPGPLRDRLIPAVVNRLPVSEKKVSFEYKAKRFVRGAGFGPEEAHYQWKVIFDEEDKAALYAEPLRERLAGARSYDLYRPYYDRVRGASPLNRLLYVDAKIYLPDDILTKADSMSMAHSLEVRPPYLDRRLVEFAASLPPGLKLRGFSKKYLLKRALAPLLPPSTLRARKRGFNVPVARWLRRELRSMVEDTLAPAALAETGLFRPEAVRRLLDEHAAFRHDHSRLIWGLLMFMTWRRTVSHGSAALAR